MDNEEILQQNNAESEIVEEIKESAEETAVAIEEHNDSGDDAEDNTEENTDEDDFSEVGSEEIPPEEKTDDTTENIEENSEKAKKKLNIPWKKIFIGAGCTVSAMAIIYLGGIAYYSSHFMYNTNVGNFDCSNMSAEKAKQSISDEINNYSFVIQEKNNVKEKITGEEIALAHSELSDFEKLIEQQKPYMWLFDWSRKEIPLDIEVSFDEDKLYQKISDLDVAKKSKQNMDGSTAGIYYENGSFHVKDDGTKDVISVNQIFGLAKDKIRDLYSGMVLEDENCYVGLEGDDSMRGVLNLINKFVSTKITYQNGSKTTILDGETIKDWVIVKEDYAVDVDKAKVGAYVAELAKTYDTVGTERKFKSSNGETVTVSGGDYGWLVDNAKETEQLNSLIWEGAQQEREPVYKRTAQTHGDNNDIENTYVEVSIGAQHMWFYKNGELIVSSDVVTGNVLNGNGTHTGIYTLKYKDRNATLKGEGYETPVSYWMPFNGGEGLHDANWRGVFGGSIYRGGGSHGCVNLPPSVAAKLYENVAPGTPVIVY